MPYGHFVAWAMWLPMAGHAPLSPVQYRWSAPHPHPVTPVKELNHDCGEKKWPVNQRQKFRESLLTLVHFRCEAEPRKPVTGLEMWSGGKREPLASVGVLGISEVFLTSLRDALKYTPYRTENQLPGHTAHPHRHTLFPIAFKLGDPIRRSVGVQTNPSGWGKYTCAPMQPSVAQEV